MALVQLYFQIKSQNKLIFERVKQSKEHHDWSNMLWHKHFAQKLHKLLSPCPVSFALAKVTLSILDFLFLLNKSLDTIKIWTLMTN